MVADVVHLVGVVGVLHLDPNFLVEQEEVQVVKQRRDILFAKVVVAAASDENAVVHREVRHGVAEARRRRISAGFERDELAIHDFAVNGGWLEIPHLVANQLSVFALAAEKIKAFPNLIRLPIALAPVSYLPCGRPAPSHWLGLV